MADVEHSFDHGGSSIVIGIDFRTDNPAGGYTHTVTTVVDGGTPVVNEGITSEKMPEFISALETKLKAVIDGASEAELRAKLEPMGYTEP